MTPAVAAIAALAAAWLVAARGSGALGRPSGRVSLADRPHGELSAGKRMLELDGVEVAYLDEGEGEPVVLLHGCPFHAEEWRDVVPRLSSRFRVIAPDLLGLGDTAVSLADDYRLPRDAELACRLLDALGVESAHFVGHDHGGATCLLLMGAAPERTRSVVLTNIEAYDAWPSDEERIYLKLVVNPITSPILWALLHSRRVRRSIFTIAAHRRAVLTDELLDEFVQPHVATPLRWQRLRRFFAWQLDADHRRATLDAVDGMRRFRAPTLVLWGRHDVNFGEAVARRLERDIPNARLAWMEQSGHLPMLEEPDAFATAVASFVEESESRTLSA